jgi:hypothetical protein
VTHLGDKPMVHPAMKRQLEREERRKKYPMCEKLSDNADERRTVNEFLEWLQEKGIWLCDRDQGSNFADYRPITKRADDLLLEFLEIDPKALEAERRAILDEQRRANGDTEKDDAPG